MKPKFSYEEVVFGDEEVSLKTSCISALRLKHLLENFPINEGKFLDIGCGMGGFTRYVKYLKPDMKVCGCDISNRALEIAKKKDIKNEINYFKYDICDIKIKDDFFDYISIFDVLEHLENPLKAINEVNRVLKKGGYIHIFVPLESSKKTLHGILNLFGIDCFKKSHTGHIQEFNYGHIKEMVEKNGFEIIDVKYSFQILSQITELAFFLLLQFVKSIEKLKKFKKDYNRLDILYYIKSIGAVILYFESSFFLHKFPGTGLHITCKKVR